MKTRKMKLKDVIQNHGMIQKAIAKKAGLSVSMFSAIANEEKVPTGGQKALIVYALNELIKGGPYSNADFWPTKKIGVKK